MLNIEQLMDRYRMLKAHENEIMSRRPEGVPRGAWRDENPCPVSSFFRVKKGGKDLDAHLNNDTVPILEIYSAGKAGNKLVEKIDLRGDDVAASLAVYSLPHPGDMTGPEMRAIRERLGLTQAQLAPLLDYTHFMPVSAMERATNPRPIPNHIARIMRAYESGWRPSDWPG